MDLKRKKYLMTILVILLFVTILLGIYFFITYEERTYKELQQAVQNSFESAILFCEENKEDITEISKEYLSMISINSTYDEVDMARTKITHMEWDRISETLKICYPMSYDKEDSVYYFFESFNQGEYAVNVLYIAAEETDIESYLTGRFPAPSMWVKICDYLYVCLEVQQMI